MRKIEKSSKIPQTLQNAPVPTKPNDVKDTIYKAIDVRTQLCEDQHYKCAYCESRITKMYNDVEHYRPKSIYYWLGYDWNNLLYACDLCNRTFKNNSFPLKDEAKKVTTPGNLSGEEPLIINPADEDPANHIKFNRHIMVGITDKGNKTIELFHLNDRDKRAELVHDREVLFEDYENQKDILVKAQMMLNSEILTDSLRNIIKEIILSSSKSIQSFQSIDSPYSGMLI